MLAHAQAKNITSSRPATDTEQEPVLRTIKQYRRDGGTCDFEYQE